MDEYCTKRKYTRLINSTESITPSVQCNIDTQFAAEIYQTSMEHLCGLPYFLALQICQPEKKNNCLSLSLSSCIYIVTLKNVVLNVTSIRGEHLLRQIGSMVFKLRQSLCQTTFAVVTLFSVPDQTLTSIRCSIRSGFELLYIYNIVYE